MTNSADLQKLLIECTLADENVFTRSQSILKADYFDKKYQTIVEFLHAYADGYRAVPSKEQIYAVTGISLEPPTSLDSRQAAWALDEIELFCRRRAVEAVIYAGPDLLAANNFGDLEERLKQAMRVSLNKGLGTNYYADPRGRAAKLRDRNNTVSTGWLTLDDILFGGFNRGELNIFAGGSGSGKSLLLQNIARNWSLAGLVVLYISLELSEELIAQRLDAMNMQMSTKDIWNRIDDVDSTIRQIGDNAGLIQIRQMPAGTTTNDIRAYVKEFEIQSGQRPDAVVVDYMDLMHPNNNKVDTGQLFVKDKYVSEELRGLASEENFLVPTASQLNRDSVNNPDHTHAHISGGISKINTADNVATIFAPDDVKAKERLRLQLIKTRSSSGVGRRLWMHYNPISMRISDLSRDEAERLADEGPDDSNLIDDLSRLRNNIRARSTAEGASSPNREDRLAQQQRIRKMAKSF